MRVLITGDRGKIGAHVSERLVRSGYTAVGFDLSDGPDLLDLAAVTDVAAGCSAIVHLGALAHDTAGTRSRSWRSLGVAPGSGVR
jgi:nucleoside-diphosphate-sugar epimerase